MNRTVLYDKVRNGTNELLNGYLDLPQVNSETGLNEYIAPSFWKKEGAGLVGAIALAQVAYEEGSSCTSEDVDVDVDEDADVDASNEKAMGERVSQLANPWLKKVKAVLNHRPEINNHL